MLTMLLLSLAAFGLGILMGFAIRDVWPNCLRFVYVNGKWVYHTNLSAVDPCRDIVEGEK